MRQTIRRALVASTILGGALGCVAQATTPAFAQATGADEAAPKQVALTQAQIDNLIAAQKDVHAATGNADKPDETKLAAAVKAHGFDSLAQYSDVSFSVGLVMAGMDPATKAYVGSVAVIQQQIKEVQADTSMPPKDKKEAIAELNAALQQGESEKASPANIALIKANFDKIVATLQQAD